MDLFGRMGSIFLTQRPVNSMGVLFLFAKYAIDIYTMYALGLIWQHSKEQCEQYRELIGRFVFADAARRGQRCLKITDLSRVPCPV